jgi:hypothetical protein
LAGPCGKDLDALLTFCVTMKNANELIQQVKQGPWQDVPADVRIELLNILDAWITKYREKRGLDPFDDPLPGAPPNAFLILRDWLS